MNKKSSRKNSVSRWPLFLVIACFTLPLVVAWMLVQSPQSVGLGPLLNKGFLLQPPLDIKSESELKPLQTIVLEPSEWGAILFTNGLCEPKCLKTLSNLTVIRELLGHSGSRFKLIGLFESDEDIPGFLHIRNTNLAQQLAKLVKERGVVEPVSDGVVFLDWRGQIVSYFVIDADPANIKKDLKRLLRASKIK
ncbi:MAG: hypothetical protein ACJ0Q9_05100 [Gammaproteobacteria bacterium]